MQRVKLGFRTNPRTSSLYKQSPSEVRPKNTPHLSDAPQVGDIR